MTAEQRLEGGDNLAVVLVHFDSGSLESANHRQFNCGWGPRSDWRVRERILNSLSFSVAARQVKRYHAVDEFGVIGKIPEED